ncbi:MAG: hypothetical protein RIQ36_1798, partial [Pseudomonadota bacterium]
MQQIEGGAFIAVYQFLKNLELLTNPMIRQSLNAASMPLKTIKNLTIDAIARWSGQGNKNTDGLQSVLDILLSSQEMGCQLVRDGQDVIRIYPDGRVERVEGLLEGLDLVQFEQQFPAQLAQLQALITGLHEPEASFQLAQAEVNSPAIASDIPSETPAPSVDKLVARVAEISGSATVVRNGLVIQLNFGDAIYVGDIVSTADNAKLKLTLLDTTQPNRPGSSALLGDQTRVLVTGQLIAVDNTQLFQVNLNVDAGALSVDKSSNPSMQIQVFTPAGQLPVPQNGLNVTVQSQTGQTAVSTLLPASTNTANAATTKLIAADGNANTLQLSTTPTILAQAVDPDIQLAQAASSSTTPMVSAITGVSPFSPLTGNNLAAPLSASLEVNPLSALASGQGALSPTPVLTAVAPFVVPASPAPKLADELAPPVIPKLTLTSNQKSLDESGGEPNNPASKPSMVFEVKFSAATSLVVGFNVNFKFSKLGNSRPSDRFTTDAEKTWADITFSDGSTARSAIRYLANDQQAFVLDPSIQVQPGLTGIKIELHFQRDTLRQDDVTITAELTELLSGVIEEGAGSVQVLLTDTQKMLSGDTPAVMQGDDGDEEFDGRGGADTINAGPGSDKVVFDPEDVVDGGTGIDSLVIKTTSLDLRTLTPQVSNLEVLDLASDTQANEVFLTKAFVDAMAVNASEPLRIEGGSTDVLRLANNASDPLVPIWYREPSLDKPTNGSTPAYVAYKSGTTTIFVNSTIQVGIELTGDPARTETIQSGPGNDTLIGSADDVLNLAETIGPNGVTPVTADLTVVLPEGNTEGSAQAGELLGNDTLVGIQNVSTGKGDDSVVGSSAANIIVTDVANDTVGSADTVDGGAGDDTIMAGAGADVIDGGAGVDSIDAGAGSDQVVLDVLDSID